MTFEKLKELIEKYNIPSNVKISSIYAWALDKTEIDGIYYNEEINHIIFTQFFNTKYKNLINYKELR